MGKVVRTSDSPFPGVPIKPPPQQPQPGEVLIRYELEAAGGCQLNVLGWCCFGALVCTAFPLSWLPFVCSPCKKHVQRPVYGYPMYAMDFIAPDASVTGTGKSAPSAPVAAPAILCMDESLEMQSLPQHDQQAVPMQLQVDVPQRSATPQAGSLPCSPTPPFTSIFVPPSVVPACGFTAANPFPPRSGSPLPAHLQGSPTPMPFTASPKVLGTCGPTPQSPGPSSGLPVMGGSAFGLSV